MAPASKGLFEGFRRRTPRTARTADDRESLTADGDAMGTAFSRGDGSHLPPMRINGGVGMFITETQADQLRPETIVERMDHDEELITGSGADPEAGGLMVVPPPEAGQMIRVKITGQAIIYKLADGRLMLDTRGY